MEAYRRGLRLIRDAIGPEAYLLGCGAPILPSVGLVDAMRVSPDTGTDYEPRHGDLSQPSVSGRRCSAARAGLAARPLLGQRPGLPARPAGGRAARGLGRARRAVRRPARVK